MAQTIKLKRSSVSGRVPTTSDLELGEVAINTYDGKMYIKKSVGGTETVVSVGGGALATSFTLYEYTASASQTTFSGSDSNSNTLAYDTGTPPKILVYLNGVLLDHSTDYTATNGTSVVLTSAAAASDLVQIAAYKSTVTSDQNLDLDDNQKILLGDDDDLQIYHDGSNSYIKDAGTGSLAIQASQLNIDSSNGSEYQATFVENGAVSLYYDGNKKVETTSGGIQVQGAMAATTGAYSPIYYGGSSSLQLKSNTGELFGQFTNNGAAELYYDNTKKFETTNDGISVTGDVEATGEIIGDLRGATLFKAQAGESLAKGEVVYISGISGNTTVVSKADADDANKMPAFGIVAAAASSGNPVDIYTAGIIADIDTSAYSEGDELFVSTTAGALTSTAPTGESAALQKIGKVTRSDATGGRIFIIGAGRTNAVPNLNTGRLFVGNSSNQAVADDTVYVDIANSRVGINTTTPSRTFEIHENTTNLTIGEKSGYTPSTYGPVFETNADALVLPQYAYLKGSQAYIRNESSLMRIHGDNGIKFSYYNGSTTTEGMRLDTSGRLGIGTTSPAKTLDVAANGSSQGIHLNISGVGRLQMYADGDRNYFTGLSGNGHRITTTGGANVEILNNGNVGIGTTSPNDKLAVAATGGGINITGSSAYLRWNSGDMMIKNEGSYKMGFYTYNATDVALNQHMVIDTNGYVGIGTASPAVELDIKRHTNAYPLRISSESGEGRAIVFADVASTPTKYNWIAGTQYNVNNAFEITPSTAVGGYTFSNPALTILQDGKVGIGDTTPSYKLDVNGTGRFTGAVTLDSTLSVGNITMTGDEFRFVSSTDSNLGMMLRDETYATDEMDITATRLGTGNTPTLGLAGQSGINFYVSGTNVGNFNSSGHLLIGKTSTGINTNGIEARTNGLLAASRDQNPALYATRTTDAGDIAKFYSGSTSVGSIGTINNILTIGSGSAGIIFNPNASPNASIYPWNVSTNSASDNAIDLGISTRRWQDLYLAGTIYGGSTLTLDPSTHGDNTGTVVIAGNLQVDGTTTTINSTTLTVDDKNITLASGSTNAAAANGAGITVDCGSDTDATFTYDGTNDEWDFNKNVKVSGSVGVTNIVTNKVVKFNGTILDDSTITDTGSLITLGTSTDVSGPLQFTSNVSFSSSEAGRIYKASNHGLAFHGVTGTENDFAMFTPAGQLMVVNPTGTNNVALVPSAAGSVGIGTGTSSPARKLEVKAGSEGYVARFKGSTSAVDIFAGNTGSFTGGLITTPTSIPLGLSTNTGAGVLIIATNDNVGIGVTDPDQKLDVNGNIRIPNAGKIVFGSAGASPGDYLELNDVGSSGSLLKLVQDSTTRFAIQGVTGNVGIGTTSPAAKLQIEEAGIDTTTTSTTATTQVAIDTFAAATFRSARYTIQVTNSTDSTYHITEILLIHDGTTPQITEYGTIFTGSAEATFDADISSGNVRLLATPATTDSMTFKVVRHCITV